MPHFKDRLTTRKKSRKLDSVVRPSKKRGGLGGANTGAGPDGVVQPDRVAFMTPKGPIHEDELMVQGANGISVIPSPRSPQMQGVPRTQAEQEQMGEQARKMGQPGFQYGGTLGGLSSGTLNMASNKSYEDAARNRPQATQPGQTPQQTTSFQRPPESALAPFSSGTKNMISDQLMEQNARNMPGGVQTQTATAQGEVSPTGAAFTPQPFNTGRNQGALGQQTPFQPTINFPETKTAQGEVTQQGAQQPIIRPPEAATPPGGPIEPTITHADSETTQGETTSAEDQARQQGLAGLSGLAAGRSPVDRTIANQALGQLGAGQAEEAGMFRQQAGQMGIEGGRLASGMAQLRQQQGLERAQLGGDLAIAAQDRAADAITQLASTSLAGQQHELTKQQVGDNEAWRQYEAALGASDFEGAAAKYEEMTGIRLNTQQLEQARDYWNKKQEQEIKRDDIIISDLEQRLGLDKVEGARAMIAAGFSLDQVNAQAGTSLTQGEFDTIRDASPLGERDWNRKLDMAEYLMTKGSTEAAIPLFNELYPNAGIDWSEQVNDANAENFGQVQGELAEQLAATNGDWDSIPQALKDGWMELTDLGETELNAWFQGMNVNSIDAQWQTIEDSDWYDGLPDEEKDDLLEIFTAVNSSELEFDVLEEFTVTTADGKEETFTDKAKADKFATDNNTTAKSTGSRVMFRDPLTGKVVDGTSAEPGSKAASGISVKGGRLIKGTGENAEELTFEDLETWSVDADKALALGAETPYYDQILKGRADSVNNLEHQMTPGSLQTDDPLYQELLTNSKTPSGLGELKEHIKGQKASEEEWFYTNMERPKGAVVNIDGKLYVIDRKVESDGGGGGTASNYSDYYFKGLDDNVEYTVRADKNASRTPRKV